MQIFKRKHNTNLKKDDILLFKHKVQVRVRTWEVDWQGIVHNSYYLRYMEIGRLEYRRAFGYNLNPDGTFNDGLKVFVVHNSVDYHAPAAQNHLLMSPKLRTSCVHTNNSVGYKEARQKSTNLSVIN